MAVALSNAKGSVPTAAAELGIDPGRISKWRQQQNGTATVSEKPGLTAEQAAISRLQKELKEAQLERDIWTRSWATFEVQEGSRHLFQGRQQLFRFINEHREVCAVATMCKVFKVSVSGYY